MSVKFEKNSLEDNLLNLALVALYVRKDAVTAKLLAQRLTELEPENANSHFLLFETVCEKDSLGAAQIHLTRALELADESDKARFASRLHTLGKKFYNSKDYSQAEAITRIVLSLQPDNLNTSVNIAIVFRAQGRHAEAESLLCATVEKILSLPQDRGMSLRHIACIYRSLENPGEEERYLRLAFAQDESSADTNLMLARNLASQNRREEAEDFLQRAIGNGQDDPEILIDCSNLLYQQDRFSEVEQLARRALELRPNDPEALNNLGAALVDLKDDFGADDALCHALALNDNFARPHYHLARLLHRKALDCLASSEDPNAEEDAQDLIKNALEELKFAGRKALGTDPRTLEDIGVLRHEIEAMLEPTAEIPVPPPPAPEV